jgi:hypothetical protein
MTENLPVNWEAQMAADAKKILEQERPAVSAMSIKSGVMTIGGEPIPNNEIECIVLASAAEMVYYTSAYDADVRTNPDCFAIDDARVEELSPHETATNKQSTTCVTCEKFQWGSDPKGGRGRACRERRRLALMPADGSAELCLLSVPSMSIKNWSNFVRETVATTGKPPAAAICKIKVVPSTRSMIEVKFSYVKAVPDEMLGMVYAKRPAAMEAVLTPYPPIEEETKPKGKRKY